MRTFVTVVAGALVIVASAFANNIAVTGSATATAGFGDTLGAYSASYALNWNSGSAWIAPGGSVNPYLLITLNQPALVDSVTVYGGGNSLLFSAFDIFVGSLAPNLGSFDSISESDLIAQLEGAGSNMTLIGTETDQADGYVWTDSFAVSTSTPIQYVLYLGISGDGPGCDVTVCAPGTGTTGVGGQDDAFTSGIVVDDPPTPEPATFGLFGAAALLFGLTRRFRHKPIRS
jgi:hypothetical protein